MSRYRFSQADCKRGGKARALQAANYRRSFPTCYEKQVQDVLTSLGVTWQAEYHLLDTATGIDFFLDIAILQGDKLQRAIEVDGSNDWHNPKYLTTNNSAYDHLKAVCLYNLGIPLLRLEHYQDEQRIITAIDVFLKSQSVPF